MIPAAQKDTHAAIVLQLPVPPSPLPSPHLDELRRIGELDCPRAAIAPERIRETIVSQGILSLLYSAVART